MPSKVLVLFLTLVTALLSGPDSDRNPSVERLPSGTILLVSNQSIWIVDEEDLHLELYINLEFDLNTTGVILSKNAEKLVYLQSPGGQPSPQDEITITQVDVTTQSRRLIGHQVGLIDFELSPSGSKAVVVHPLDVETFRNGFPLTVCILDIDTGECSESNLIVSRIQWIDDNAIIAGDMGHRTIYRINTSTFEREEIYTSWSISHATYIPSKNELLIAEKPSADHGIEFTVLNLSTWVASVLPYGVEDIYCYSIDDLSIAPNAQHMVYSCAGPDVLVDYQTGKTIAVFEHLGSTQWSADGKSIITFYVNDESRSLVKIDVSTGTIVESVDFPGRGWLVAVP